MERERTVARTGQHVPGFDTLVDRQTQGVGPENLVGAHNRGWRRVRAYAIHAFCAPAALATVHEYVKVVGSGGAHETDIHPRRFAWGHVPRTSRAGSLEPGPPGTVCSLA